ncbi:uncharacterized protein LOC110819120 isoform X1 [Carica papaya]|uniref:uncharacterized protein LOC110819120 isoform X1 n=1 Tax=Carica papaya TaxID=3649 RepID=UPI000B8CB209|nr:uncharacterized protein LOC110819120 isoform X1 [Carica papaya]
MDSRTGNSRSLKPVDKNMQQRMIRSSKTINAKVATASGDSPTMIPSKPGVVKATKKSSVVPIESKSLSRKSLGIGRATHPVVSKVKGSQLDESLKGCGNVIETQEKKVVMNALTTESGLQDVDTVSVGQHGAAVGSEPPAKSHQDHDKISNFDLLPGDCNHGFKDNGVSSKDDEVEEESTISPTAWIEIEEHEDVRNSCVNRASQLESSANVVPVQSASPRVRHSLSQMLQEESSEADNTEWENAENPPIMTNQKDAPKGLKRLLKFARKSKGDANISGLSSPLVFSEGEDEGEESKVVSKRNADNLLRKAALHARNYGYQKKSLSEVHEQNKDSHEPLSAAKLVADDLMTPAAQSNLRKLGRSGSRKLDNASFSATSSTTKQQGHSSLFRHLWGANRVK